MKKKDLNFDLKQLRSFMEVLREKSFTTASRNLKIGQATISNQIQNLEDALGVDLIKRTSKKFTVTEEGYLLKSFCEQLFSDIENLKKNLAKGLQGGVTRIASSTIPSTYILPSIIAKLKTNHADSYYSINVSDSREVFERIKEGRDEVGITGKEYKHNLLIYEKFLVDEIVLAGNEHFPDKIDPDDIKKIPLVSRENGSGTKSASEDALKKKNILPSELNIVFESNTSEGAKEAIISGVGATFISKLAIQREVSSGLIKIIQVKGLKIQREFYIVYQKNKHLSNQAINLINYLKA